MYINYSENTALEWDMEPFASSIEDAMELRESDPTEFVKILEKLAKNGSVLSMIYLGDVYANGRGVPIDIDRGLKWYERASERGSIEATHRLARWNWSYDDYDKTMQLLLINSRKGFSPAMYLLGLMYLSDKHTKSDVLLAIKYWKSAEEQGHLLAKRRLSILLRNGELGIIGRVKGYLKLVNMLPKFVYFSMKFPNSDRLRDW